MNSQKIGKCLKRLRGKKTQKRVCEDLGISDSALSAYELGKRIPKDDIKKLIAKYYGKSVEELFYAD